MRIRAAFVAFVTGACAIAASLLIAPAASADSVWFQSVARASSTAACPDASFGTPWQSGWSLAEQPWRPSWAQWPNGGTGGFTCDRQITWAKNGAPAYPSGQCEGADSTYYAFNGGWSVNGLDTEPVKYYSDAACTTSVTLGSYDLVVYAPAGYSASQLCEEAFGTTRTPTEVGGDVYLCGQLA